MNKKNITNDRGKVQGQNASVRINIRITLELSKWLKDKKYSPTGIFQEAVKELGYDPTE